MLFFLIIKVLENMDQLFEDEVQFKGITNAEDGSIDFSLFMISPNRAMWKSLLANLCHNGNGRVLKIYFEKYIFIQQNKIA